MYRTCHECKRHLPLDSFGSNKTQPYGKSYMCKECRPKYHRKRYEQNAPKRREQIYASRSATKESNRSKLWTYLTEHECVDCGLVDPVVMEFDHVRGIKKYSIGTMITSSYSWETIKREILKCDLVCANCHRRRTNKQFSWWRSNNQVLIKEDSD